MRVYWLIRNWKQIFAVALVGAAVVGALAWYKSHEKKPVAEKYAIIFRHAPLPDGVQEGEFPENVFPSSFAYDSLITHARFDNVTKIYGGDLEDLRRWADSISKKAGEEDFALVMLHPGHGSTDHTSLGSYKDIARALEPLEKKGIPTGIIIDTCDAGYAIDDLQASRRFIMTETSKDQYGDAISDLRVYMPRAYKPWEFTYKIENTFMPFIYSLDADISPKDNQLTALELFNFAVYNMKKYDEEVKIMKPARVIREPQIWDSENWSGKIIMGSAISYQGENLGPLYHGE
ncbi:MAG: hypothetical protein KAV43_04645 [Hadesarchaea archaeon]|nr:hypothetical protein [Hadesarchaea archaeon]